MATQQWLALMNLVAHDGKYRIVKGSVQRVDDNNLLHWAQADGQAVARGTVIQAGSTFEADLPKSRVRIWQGIGALGDVADQRHFDLERVFPQPVSYFGVAQSLGAMLQACGIYTVEDVIANAKGSLPLMAGDDAPQELGAHEVLAMFVDPDDVADLIDEAKAVLDPPKAVDAV